MNSKLYRYLVPECTFPRSHRPVDAESTANPNAPASSPRRLRKEKPVYLRARNSLRRLEILFCAWKPVCAAGNSFWASKLLRRSVKFSRAGGSSKEQQQIRAILLIQVEMRLFPIPYSPEYFAEPILDKPHEKC